jgi:hypothetical protein
MATILRFLIGMTLAALAIVAVVGALGIAFSLLGLAIKVALLGLAAYLVIRIVSPDTASRLRDRCSTMLPGRSRY